MLTCLLMYLLRDYVENGEVAAQHIITISAEHVGQEDKSALNLSIA